MRAGYGGSRVGPSNEATATLEARVKHTTLATLALWMEESGHGARSKSWLVRQGLEVLEEMIVANGGREFVSTEEAMNWLEENGFTGLNRNGRGRRALANQLHREDGTEIFAKMERVRRTPEEIAEDKRIEAEIAARERAQQEADRNAMRKICMTPEGYANIQASAAKLEAERLASKAAQMAQIPATVEEEHSTTALIGSDVETMEDAIARRAREAKEEKAKIEAAMAEARRRREEKANENV